MTWTVYDKNGAERCEIHKLEYSGTFMGEKFITASIKSPHPIDFSIGDYVTYRGEQFTLNYDPSIIKKAGLNKSGDAFTYDNIKFNSYSDELVRCEFLDYVLNDNLIHFSSLPTFGFHALTIQDLADRIKANLDRVYTGLKEWTVNVDASNVSVSNVFISADKLTVWGALALASTIFKSNFIIRGRTITIGTAGNIISDVFEYGKGNGLNKITRVADPEQQIITRLRVYGSTRNLPFRYYNKLTNTEPYLPDNMAVQNLMLPSFPYTTLNPYIDSTNIAALGVMEGSVFFDGSDETLPEIYPSLEGMTASDLINAGVPVSLDAGDNGNLDEIVSDATNTDGTPIADDGIFESGEIPQFRLVLKDIGFDLNDYLTTETAVISLKTGMNGGREFEIVSCVKQGNKYILTCNRVLDDGIGRYFPYASMNIKAQDKFVLLNIDMPEVYIQAASQRLLAAGQEYLSKNDYVRYTYSVNISPVYMARNPLLHDTIVEGDYLQFADTDLNISGSVIIDNLRIKEGEEVVPIYEVTLTEEKQVGTLQKIQNQINYILSGGGGSVVDIKQTESLIRLIGNRQFLSKLTADIAQKTIQFLEGITVGTYNDGGLLGSGATIKNVNGTTVAEVDQLLVRQRAEFFSVLIHEAKHIGGELVISAADMLCIKVEEFTDFYRCYFDSKNGEVTNLFENTDFARCQIFTGTRQKFYWRKVVAVGTDYIELSKTNAAVNSDIPAVGDYIFQLGSTNIARQGAHIISSVGVDAPSWIQYNGINSFSLEGKEGTYFKRTGNRIVGSTVFLSGGSNLEDWATGTSQDVQDAQAAANAAALAAQQAIDDAEANVTLINTEVGKLQAQIDGEVSNWFYPYSPTLANYPASDWTTNTIKDRHVGDTFTNTAQAPAADAGKSWRFVKNGTVYSWTQIADSDAVLALQKAAQAQSTADGKSTTYLIQPTKYSLGDMWVLNADQTVNGIAYKSGEILTATQDSTTYNQAHWVKKVRYTDDTAVNNIQIGGVNLIINSRLPEFLPNDVGMGARSSIKTDGGDEYYTYTPDAGKQLSLYGYFRSYPAGKQYTGGIFVRHSNSTAISVNLYISIIPSPYNGFKTTLVQPNVWTYIYLGIIGNPIGSHSGHIMITGDTGIPIDIKKIKLEEGNKPTAWDESPEDINLRINTAKQEALTAAGNAQTSANTANMAVGDLNTYVDGSFKDGVIETSEAKAIEKYINVVNTEKSNLEATYNTLYANTYLEGTPKSDLLNAKVTYFGAVDNLLSAINTAITDGKTTLAEKNAVDSNYTSYKTALASLQTAIENANKAIQTKLDTLSTDKINNIQIGGINLITGDTSLVARTALGWTHIPLSRQLVEGKTYILGGEFRIDTGTSGVIGLNNADFNTGLVVPPINIPFVATAYMASRTHFALAKQAGTSPDLVVSAKEVKLEEGNKKTSWSQSPEYVKFLIDTEKTRINEILSDNLADPSEKQYLSNLWQEIYAEYPRILAQANTYAVDKSNYEAKYSALNTLLSPVLTNLTVNSTVAGASIRTAFSQYYDARIFLQNAITNKVNQNAGDAKLTAEQAQLAADGYMRARYIRDWVKGSSVNNDNHWSEVKIINKSGTNLANGKTPTTNGTFTTNPSTYATDNNLSTYASVPDSESPVYIQIDLGQIYYDIDYIQIWHYYLDGRTYYGTKTEISTDGVNWTPVLDSAKSGTYKETAAGNIISLRPHEVLAKTLKSQAITDKFGTTIDGGLIGAVTMLLRELNSTDETAGISGIRGANRNLPAFWTGTYADAIAGTAGIIFRHNSTGKIGVLDVDANGNVKLLDSIDPSIVRLLFSKSAIPSIESIRSGSDSGSVQNASVLRNTTLTSILPETATITNNGVHMSISGSLRISAGLAAGYNYGEAYVGLSLYKNDVFYSIVSQYDMILESASLTTETTPFNVSLVVPAGTYSLVLETSFLNASSGSQAGTNTATTMTWVFEESIRRFEWGTNGFMNYRPNGHIHHTEEKGLDVRGATNTPGVLLSGSVAIGGGFVNSWGAKKHATLTAQKTATGTYTVYHSAGHTGYSVQITPETDQRVYYVPTANKGTSSFIVYFRNLAGTLSDSNFSFSIMGDNYIT